MSKRIYTSILVCIFLLSAAFFVSQANAAINYYSNSFDSASSLDDGYWSLHDAGIQSVDGSGVLGVDGEATFNPQHGGYALNNFTVQFDIFHNIIYENNSAFQGPFYEAADAHGNTIIRMGIYQRQIHNSDLQQVGGLDFSNTTTGQSSHYYFPLSHAADWSTWRLTVTTVSTEGGYIANVTVQIDGETVTDFATGMPRPDGIGEIFVSNITNESVLNPVAYQNLLPLPMAGVILPTYAPTACNAASIHYDLMSSRQIKPVSSGATTSYIDNFNYGYANAVPLSANPTPTPTLNEATATPISTAISTGNPTINTGAQSPQVLFQTILAVFVVLAAIVVIAVVAYLKNRRRSAA
jgi:hypothetical protein